MDLRKIVTAGPFAANHPARRAAVAKELHDGHADQDIIVQDQDGLNGRRLAVAVGHRHARILPSRRLIAVLWEGEPGKVERSCKRSLRTTLRYAMRWRDQARALAGRSGGPQLEWFCPSQAG